MVDAPLTLAESCLCSAVYRGLRDVQSGGDMDVSSAYPGALRASVTQVYLAQGAEVLTLVEQLVAGWDTATSATTGCFCLLSYLDCLRLIPRTISTCIDTLWLYCVHLAVVLIEQQVLTTSDTTSRSGHIL